jgi:uncharacterized membrane protein YhaH (DUF805 family)
MFSTKKRINRLTYLLGIVLAPISIYIVLIILSIVANLIPGLQSSLSKSKPDTLVNIAGGLVMAIYFSYIALVCLYFLILIKQRANDITDKGLLVGLIALISIVGILALILIPGKKSQNRYGSPMPNGLHLLH